MNQTSRLTERRESTGAPMLRIPAHVFSILGWLRWSAAIILPACTGSAIAPAVPADDAAVADNSSNRPTVPQTARSAAMSGADTTAATAVWTSYGVDLTNSQTNTHETILDAQSVQGLNEQ